MHQTKRKWRTFGEKHMGIKLNIMERRAGLKKPVPTKFKHGMESNMRKRRCRNSKKNAKLESPWKRPNKKFLA
jgi:hypothetical protein